MKHRIICNMSLAAVLGYRIYLILNSTQYESFYSGTYSGKIGTELLFRFLWQWLPFIVIAVGFLANFFKHPVDIAIHFFVKDFYSLQVYLTVILMILLNRQLIYLLLLFLLFQLFSVQRNMKKRKKPVYLIIKILKALMIIISAFLQ